MNIQSGEVWLATYYVYYEEKCNHDETYRIGLYRTEGEAILAVIYKSLEGYGGNLYRDND